MSESPEDLAQRSIRLPAAHGHFSLCGFGFLFWADALQARFPARWRELALQSEHGLRQLLAAKSEDDFDEVLHTSAYGLLASQPPTNALLRTAGERLLADAVDPLEKLAKA